MMNTLTVAARNDAFKAWLYCSELPGKAIAEARGYKTLPALRISSKTSISKPTKETSSVQHSLHAGWIIEVLQPRCNPHHIRLSAHS
jgi:hypothetical protein